MYVCTYLEGRPCVWHTHVPQGISFRNRQPRVIRDDDPYVIIRDRFTVVSVDKSTNPDAQQRWPQAPAG